MAISLSRPHGPNTSLLSDGNWKEIIRQRIKTKGGSISLPAEQQMQSLLTDTYLEHNINLTIDSVANKNKLTQIVCTIGPASRSVAKLTELISAGMNICRLNFSHGTYEYHQETLNNIRDAAAKMPPGKVLGVALDTKGPEIRTGLLTGGAAAKDIELKTGATIKLTINDYFKEKCSVDVLWVDYKNILNILKEEDVVYVDDGLISLKIKEKKSDCFICTILNGGLLGSKKGCNLPGITLDLPAISQRDKEDILFGLGNGIDMIFASFIQSGENIREIRAILGEKGKNIKIIAKIESFSGLWNFMEILEETDGVMVARGDMGIEIPPEKVFVAQKMLISACNWTGKPVICATQMLESMVNKPRATRAESNDVANACLDGADCVMLSGETAKGSYPVEAVSHMAAVCREAEAVFFSKKMFNELKLLTPFSTDGTQAVALSAVDISYQCLAKGIVTMSDSGRTAHLLSCYRPRCPVIVVTQEPLVARQGLLYRCIVPYCISAEDQAAQWEAEMNRRVNAGLRCGKDWGYFTQGDPIVLVTGLEPGSGNTSCIMVVTCP